MRANKKAESPADMEQVRQQLEEFRSTHRPRRPLPEALWISAVGLARQHGTFPTARALQLDYATLKKRMGEGRAARPAATFVELRAPAASTGGFVVELESPRGRMRVEMRAAPDWTQLLRAWREAER
jgi:hypothetical protein